MQKPDNFDYALRNMTFSADFAVVNAKVNDRHTPVELVRLAIEAALTSGIVNGMISLNPTDQWVEWMPIDNHFDSD